MNWTRFKQAALVVAPTLVISSSIWVAASPPGRPLATFGTPVFIEEEPPAARTIPGSPSAPARVDSRPHIDPNLRTAQFTSPPPESQPPVIQPVPVAVPRHPLPVLTFGGPEPKRLISPVPFPAANQGTADRPPTQATFQSSPYQRNGDRAWVRAEALWWWINGASTPPLATQSPNGTPLAQAGVLGTPGTRTLFGNEDVNNDGRLGYRILAGWWLDDQESLALDADFFWLAGRGETLRAGAADASRIVSRPFINAVTGAQDAELVSFPGVLTGFVTASPRSSSFLGASGVLRFRQSCNPCRPFDLLVGYRFLTFEDSILIREDLVPQGPNVVPGSTILVRDFFRAANEFHGGTLGFRAASYSGPWTLEITPKVSLGQSRTRVDIAGNTIVTVPGVAPVTSTGGLLAQTSNIGSYTSRQFSVVPEVQFNTGYRLSPRLRVVAGYTFLAWLRVARAAEQIDLAVNPNLIPPAAPPAAGPQRPRFDINRSDMFLHGINAGLEWVF